MLRYLANDRRHLPAREPAICRPYWEIHAVIDGRCAPTFHDHEWPALQERTLWIFAPECRHGWAGERDQAHHRIALHSGSVPQPLEALVRGNARLCHAMKLNDAQVARLEAIARELEPHLRQPTALSPLHLQGRLADLAVMILSGTAPTPPPDPSQLAAFKVERARSWYVEHLSRAPSVKEVAAATHTSTSHLRRLFWQVQQASPKSIFQETRLERAQEMLGRCTVTLEEVARACGFTGASHLCREYKARYHVSPTVWRKNHAVGGAQRAS